MRVSDAHSQAEERGRRDALLAEYAEVNNNFRLLTNIRFKLLAFLPLAPAAAFALITASEKGSLSRATEARTFALGLFGILVTAGLATYNARNDQIYLWHVDRAATIERELGIPDGSFSNRPNSWFAIGSGKVRWLIGHVSSVTVIYSASIALWLFLCLLAATQISLGSSLLKAWECAVALVGATGAVVGGNLVIRWQRERRRDVIADHARRAIDLVEKLEQTGPDDRSEDTWEALIAACEQLVGRDRNKTHREKEIRLRIEYYGAHEEAELRGRFLRPDTPGLSAAAQYVSLIVDLPPSWLTESPQRRASARGEVAAETTGRVRDAAWHRRPPSL